MLANDAWIVIQGLLANFCIEIFGNYINMPFPPRNRQTFTQHLVHNIDVFIRLPAMRHVHAMTPHYA